MATTQTLTALQGSGQAAQWTVATQQITFPPTIQAASTPPTAGTGGLSFDTGLSVGVIAVGNVTLRMRLAVSIGGALTINFIRDPHATAWADDNPPDGSSTSDVIPANERRIQVFSDFITDPVGTDIDFTFDLSTDVRGGWNPLVRNRSWDGVFRFELLPDDGAPTNVGFTTTSIELSWTYDNEFTGKSSDRQNISRVDECPVCGRKTFREDWVYCGFHKRLECPECWDPVDEQERRRILPPETPPVGEDG